VARVDPIVITATEAGVSVKAQRHVQDRRNATIGRESVRHGSTDSSHAADDRRNASRHGIISSLSRPALRLLKHVDRRLTYTIRSRTARTGEVHGAAAQR